MAGEDLRYLTLADAAALVKSKKVSPVELTESCFEVIDAVDGKINSFITPTRDLAMAAAKEMSRS